MSTSPRDATAIVVALLMLVGLTMCDLTPTPATIAGPVVPNPPPQTRTPGSHEDPKTKHINEMIGHIEEQIKELRAVLVPPHPEETGP